MTNSPFFFDRHVQDHTFQLFSAKWSWLGCANGIYKWWPMLLPVPAFQSMCHAQTTTSSLARRFHIPDYTASIYRMPDSLCILKPLLSFSSNMNWERFKIIKKSYCNVQVEPSKSKRSIWGNLVFKAEAEGDKRKDQGPRVGLSWVV